MKETGENNKEQKQRKRWKMSKVWEHFNQKKRENTARCVHCKTELAYHDSTTSTLQQKAASS